MSENTAAEQSRLMPKHGEFCWTEIATDNLEASRTFYAEVFGWKYRKSEATGADIVYLEFGTETDQRFGGMFEMKPEWYGGNPPPPHISDIAWTVLRLVAAAILGRAKATTKQTIE